jgi:membrane protein implicated in regulation of membrane protease activity
MSFFIWLWIVVGLVCAILEILLPFFALIFAASSCAVAAGVGAFGFSPLAQAIAFATALVGQLFLLRPPLVRRFQGRRGDLPGRSRALEGRIGEVIAVDADLAAGSTELGSDGRSGRVRVEGAGEDWAFRCAQTLRIGDRIRVTKADGIVLNVEKT